MKKALAATVCALACALSLTACDRLAAFWNGEPLSEGPGAVTAPLPSVSTPSPDGTTENATVGGPSPDGAGAGNPAATPSPDTTATETPVAPAPDSAGTETPAPHQHSYTAEVAPPGCTTEGYTLYTCGCGDSYTADATPALGHDWGEWEILTPPTTSAPGERQLTCGRCGALYSELLPQLTDTAAYAAEIVALVNQARESNGLATLVENADLSAYATLRAQEIVDNFAHSRPDGANPLEVVIAAGYGAAGENIAYGYTGPQSVMAGWLASPGHYANIMGADFSSIGVGCVEVGGTLYWAQIFAG